MTTKNKHARQVISVKNLPIKFDVTKTVFWLFFMDYYKVPIWAFASIVTLMIIDLILSIRVKLIEKQVNIFEDDNN